MSTATKTGIDAAKTASKRVIRKTAEATGDLIGYKIAVKITSAGDRKIKGKEKEDEKMRYKKLMYHQEQVNKLLIL